MSRLPSIRDDDAEDAAKKPFVPPHLLGELVGFPCYIYKATAEAVQAHAWVTCKPQSFNLFQIVAPGRPSHYLVLHGICTSC